MEYKNRYRVEIGLDDELDWIMVNDEPRPLDDIDPHGIYYRGHYVNVGSNHKKGTDEWENDMINGALDTFRGTDWSNVFSINY